MTALFSSTPSPELLGLWHALRSRESIDAATLPPSAEVFLALYGPVARAFKTPFVIAQLGQSLDGYIATQSGASHYVTGPASLIHLHRLRALCDAVIVGWRTVAADDPQLTVRHVEGDNPLRVVVDMEGRLPPHHRLFTAMPGGALRLTGPGVAPLSNVDSEQLPLKEGRADPHEIVAALTRRGCKNILVEGGGALVSSFLRAGALDRLHIAVAPLLIGEGRKGIDLPASGTLKEALRPQSRYFEMGDDVLFDLALNAPPAK